MTFLQNYIDCVERPLVTHNDARIPDGYISNTIAFMDAYDGNPMVTPINSSSSAITVAAVGVTFVFGMNEIRAGTYNIDGAGDLTKQLYGPVFFYLDPAGDIILWETLISEPADARKRKRTYKNIQTVSKNTNCNEKSDELEIISQATTSTATTLKCDEIEIKRDTNVDATFTSFWWAPQQDNYSSIWATSNGFQASSSLVTQLRMVSMGYQILPTIEVLTSSETFGVGKYYTAQVAIRDITELVSGANIYITLKEAISYLETGNAQGCMARWIPNCDQGTFKATTMQYASIYSFNDYDPDSGTFNTDGLIIPCTVVQFTAPVSVAVGNALSLPIRYRWKINMEGTVRLPSPLVSSRPPYVDGVEEQLKRMSVDFATYPSVASGHTLGVKKNNGGVWRKVGKGVSAANNIRKGKLGKAFNNIESATNNKSANDQVSKNTSDIKIASSSAGMSSNDALALDFPKVQYPKRKRGPKRKQNKGSPANSSLAKTVSMIAQVTKQVKRLTTTVRQMRKRGGRPRRRGGRY